MNSIHNFVSGENFFRPMVNLSRPAYIQQVKDTLNDPSGMAQNTDPTGITVRPMVKASATLKF